VSANASTIRPLYSGELARLAGVSGDTIRFYERSGLLPAAPRSAAGYRVFPREALGRVRLIRSALAIGFSVRELADIFRERDRGGAPCRRVRQLVAGKLTALESQLRDLQSWRAELRRALAQWDFLLEKTPRGKRARLLESFAVAHPQNRARSSNLRAPRGDRKPEKQR
jgi:DNA-binding transcriptional MerR regulator